MSKFKANNTLTPIHDQVILKSQFAVDAYQEEGPEIFEFNFIEYSMYGAIDLEGSSIYPNNQFIKNFKGTPGEPSTFQGFDFVTKMHIDARRNIQLAISMGELVNDNPLISNMEIVRAYEPPLVAYKSYLSLILIEFNEKIKANKTLLDNITSFDHYVKELLVHFSDNYQNKPLTLSGWLQSTENSLFSTGLAFSIADISFDDDNQKYDEFMSSSLFPFYKRVMLNKGFKIWKHCPYVLVADIGSPAIVNYLNTNIEDTINTYYNKSYNIDYVYLYNNIIEFYNYIVLENPYKIELSTCRKRTTKSITYRTEQDTNSIDHFFWINYYLDVRNIELGNLKGKSEIKKIKKYLKNLRNSLDNSSMISYIDSTFREETFRKSYGLSDSIRRLRLSEQQRDQQEGIVGGSTIVGGSSGGY